MSNFPLDWSALNTALIVGAIAYLYRQARIVDQVRQALLGMNGHGGVLDEIKLLRERTHTLANTMQALNGSVDRVAAELASVREVQLHIRRDDQA